MNCICCNGTMDIEFNCISFCFKCFNIKIIRKVRQRLNTVKSKIFFIYSDGRNFIKKISILNEILKMKHNITVFIPAVKNLEKVDHFFTVLENFHKKGMNDFLTEIKLNYHIDSDDICIIDLHGSDEIALLSMLLFTEGKGKEAVSFVNQSKNILRPFENISDKEISLYFDNTVDIIEIENNISKEREIIRNFMEKMNKQNYSTSFNIVEILKKVGDKTQKQ